MIRLRMSQAFLASMLTDLQRSHPFAMERIGFVCCRQSKSHSGSVLLAYRYEPIKDDQYIEDATVGAKFDSDAIRFGMQLALSEKAAIFHVHMHPHSGKPRFSRVDEREMSALMPCFVNVCPDKFHGALIVSSDRACARVWGSGCAKTGTDVERITAVGLGVEVLS